MRAGVGEDIASVGEDTSFSRRLAEEGFANSSPLGPAAVSERLAIAP